MAENQLTGDSGINTDIEIRKLSQLRVSDLKAELKRRNLDTGGNKSALMERLKKATPASGSGSAPASTEASEPVRPKKRCPSCNIKLPVSWKKLLCQQCATRVLNEESAVAYKDFLRMVRKEMSDSMKVFRESMSAQTVVNQPPIVITQVPSGSGTMFPATSGAQTIFQPINIDQAASSINLQPPVMPVEQPGAVSAIPIDTPVEGQIPGAESGHKKARTKTDRPVLSDSEPEEYSEDISECDSEDEVSEKDQDKPSKFRFSANETDELLKAIYDSLGLKQDSPASMSAHDALYAGMEGLKPMVFPVHPSTKQLIDSQWKNPDRKVFLSRGFKRRFPFAEEDCKQWDKCPKLDAAFSQVHKENELSFEDLGFLKDQSDKKAEFALKKTWSAICANFRPAAATTCVGRTLDMWMHQVMHHIKMGSSKETILNSFTVMFKAINFIIDAATESIRLTARAAALSNVARRNIWIKTWEGSNISKSKLCTIPFSGDLLFGHQLDEILERSSDKKKGFPKKTQFRPGKRFFRKNRQGNKPRPQNKRKSWSFSREQNRPNALFGSSDPSTKKQQ
ncbi:lamina-associated polypeptide 2-like isoform X1 [Hyperolius riggenbachi]|uniref:lamina-associated polypeptide 2-like isoform X1 n=1 Tax=Hyperolius riggenbachi TaxID=752182 RepID=UPI0035A2C75F